MIFYFLWKACLKEANPTPTIKVEAIGMMEMALSDPFLNKKLGYRSVFSQV